MINVTFNLSNLYQHGSAFWDFLALRKRHFVDELGWDIPHDDEVEMDQYDNPTAHYSVVLRDGVVVGGARTMATSAEWGSHRYMLKDALDGKLGDIPPDVMPRNIQMKSVWECTRLVISDDVRTHAERNECLSLIVQGLAEVAARNGADRMISLSPLALTRALRQLGYDCERIGAPYLNDGDGRRYAVLAMPTAKTRTFTPKATHRPNPTPLHAPQVV